ncbi:RNA polymerase subunit sigma-70 [Siphonobacter sp. BAB-5385]|uniref:RNA polymerase sigma factor n=1 Tax=Siphonobacter sp. BAB-5385 TaxID=1864822 RepID=UPI000B9DE20C|nr:sigma-70 family RNA polymerase sigma factor [Siphonobacter sp. BAB-5385]OZI06208.1 RNA polymerase subunit sigma-70 [Siphonobacter sp. BAB-5385]
MFLKLFRKSDAVPSETELLEQYRQTGDLRILGQLYEPHMEMLYAVCYKYLSSEDAAKDAVMQVFEELVNKARTHEISNWKSWLHSVAKNYCLMQLRSRKEFVDAERMESEDRLHLVEEAPEDPLPLQELDDCLKKLNREQQQTVSLFFLQEKSYRQIVEETGYELNQVKSYLQNGRRNLKLCMEAQVERFS